MSISSDSTRKAGPFTGTGLIVSYPFSYKVFQAADVLVVRTDLSGTETTLALGTDYTVTLNSNQDASPGGTVNPVAAAPTGYLTTLSSQVAALQPVVLTNSGGFYPTVLNDAMDRLTIIVQQLKEQMSRAVTTSISSSISPATLTGYIVALYNNLANIISVAGNSTNINSAVSNATNINTVAGNNTNVTNVGGSIANVNAVAVDLTNINTAAANLTAINAAPAAASAAAASATSASNSANSTAALLLSFRNVYLGYFSSDVNAVAFATANSITLSNGISYENTSTQKVRIYNGSTWADQDSDAQTQSANATAAAVSAAASSASATVQANIATAQEVIATAQANNAIASANAAAGSVSSASSYSALAAAAQAAAAASAVSAVNAPGTSGTSTTSLTIGLTTQSFNTQTAKNWVVGQFVTLASTASPANWMYGYINTYNSTTGAMSVVVLSIGGSGTFASWSIGLSAPVAQFSSGNVISHANLITQSFSIPDGINAIWVDPTQVGTNVTVTGLGNSTLRGI